MNLYAYEIASGTVTLVGRLEPALYAGSHVRDSRATCTSAGSAATAFEGEAGLAILSPEA